MMLDSRGPRGGCAEMVEEDAKRAGPLAWSANRPGPLPVRAFAKGDGDGIDGFGD